MVKVLFPGLTNNQLSKDSQTAHPLILSLNLNRVEYNDGVAWSNIDWDHQEMSFAWLGVPGDLFALHLAGSIWQCEPSWFAVE